MEKGVKLEGVEGVRYLYHDPCHTPMKTHQPLKVVRTPDGRARSALNDRCCGESGTFAATAPGHRHPGALPQGRGDAQGRGARRARDGFDGDGEDPDLLPVLPAGTARYNDDAGTTADYIVVEMARQLLGEDWMQEYVDAGATTAASSACCYEPRRLRVLREPRGRDPLAECSLPRGPGG